MGRHTGGWVKLHRKILKSWIAEDSASLSIFTLLVLYANHERSKEVLHGSLITVERGQTPLGVDQLARKLKLGAKVVRNRLDRLEKDNVVVTQRTNRGTIVTLVNYDLYQGSDENGASRRRADGEQRANRRRAEGNSGRREEEKERKEEKNPPISPRALAVRTLAKAEGAIRRKLCEEDARTFLGELEWSVLTVRYGSLEEFAKAYALARTAPGAVPSIVEAQMRESLMVLAEGVLADRGHGGGQDAPPWGDDVPQWSDDEEDAFGWPVDTLEGGGDEG